MGSIWTLRASSLGQQRSGPQAVVSARRNPRLFRSLAPKEPGAIGSLRARFQGAWGLIYGRFRVDIQIRPFRGVDDKRLE